jgi:hypothetical protein
MRPLFHCRRGGFIRRVANTYNPNLALDMATTSRRTSLKMENNYCHTLLHKKVLIAFQLHDDGHTVVTSL